ncbi:uncharacterized protein LOC125863750 [Solanum stenotomum]|uniref:uncharacterized protein LOC125863750 n=1 Tax=Solanum stenotomum TaxID=172797 RepID=UPI0020D043E0|nr:uncharacterized protein LOC125863750 [Solanum stenotomum]
MDADEKLGGLPVTQMEITDFVQCTNACALNEIKFKCSSYTWWNDRIEEESIFKRLDKVFGNNELMSLIPNSEVHHLIRQGSDHALLHVIGNSLQEIVTKPLKFLNFWTKQSEFKKVVEDNWNGEEINGNPFKMIHSKIKRIKSISTQWSRRTFGDIFQRIATLDDTIKVMEIQMEITPTTENKALLHKAEAELKIYRHIEEEFWRQKEGMKWFKEGDRNTKFFHAYVKGKRRKLQVVDILTNQGDKISTTQNIGEEAVNAFREKFRENQETTNYDMLEYIPTLINEEQNADMGIMPTEDKVRMVVFTLNGESASGSGFSGKFFKSCWDIVGNDMTNMVKAFFCGQDLPRYITHTNLVLIPKKKVVVSYGDLRPISLSFVKGRSITENVLLAQEIVRDINLRNKLHNVVVKLDMAKAYDRSSRGLKQGDPLSPTLFIIIVEVLARGLNSLYEDSDFKGINMEDMHLQQLIIQWWSLDANPKLQLLYRAVPAVIRWTIWKRRNNLKHEKTVTFDNMVEQVEKMLRKLLRGVYPWIRPEKANWPHLVAKLQNYKPKIYHHSVVWQRPERDKVKCNTDGTSKGDHGEHIG